MKRAGAPLLSRRAAFGFSLGRKPVDGWDPFSPSPVGAIERKSINRPDGAQHSSAFFSTGLRPWLNPDAALRLRTIVVAALVFLAFVFPAFAAESIDNTRTVVETDHAARTATNKSLANNSFEWPTAAAWARAFSFRDHNTRIVTLGTMLLGLASGIIGPFMLLRRRALVGDAVSHATLPGIAVAFLVMSRLGHDGKSLPALLLGATLSGLLGIGVILVLRAYTRLKEDAALGIVLSVFFGFGVALLGIIQSMSTGESAGLKSFIYGKTASMITSDAVLIGASALLTVVICAALFKEFALLCFDEDYASSQGWPTTPIDMVMMGLVIGVTVIGLQAVGLILMVAMLIIPPAAARFWTNRLLHLVAISAGIGAASGLLGSIASAVFERLPAGAVIVVISGVAFVLSMIFGSERGVLVRVVEHIQLVRQVGMQNLLRAMHERIEAAPDPTRDGVEARVLLAARSWSHGQLRRLVARAKREGLIREGVDGALRLTESGLAEARRVVRNHRLWELYLITHADIAPGNVDRNADRIEHVLGRELVDKLEALMVSSQPQPVPASPHVIERPRPLNERPETPRDAGRRS